MVEPASTVGFTPQERPVAAAGTPPAVTPRLRPVNVTASAAYQTPFQILCLAELACRDKMGRNVTAWLTHLY